MLFGHIVSEEIVSVYYAPPIFDIFPEHTFAHAYSFGRTTASKEAAWQLRGWSILGFWIAHEGPENDPKRLVRILEGQLHTIRSPLDLELVLINLMRMPDHSVDIRARTCVSSTSMKTWRELELTDLTGNPLGKPHETQQDSGEGNAVDPLAT